MLGKAKETTEDKNLMNGVVRTMTILEVLAHSGSTNLENLSKETNLPKATLLRFLSSFISLGYVSRDDADCYSLTLRLFSIGSKALKHVDMITKAQPFAKALCEELGETVHVGIEEDNKAVYVIKRESSYTLRMYSRVGKTIPLYCTAIGKILLANKSDAELKRYFNSVSLIPFTEKTLRTKDAIIKELEVVREQGYAIDNEEHEESTICIASGIKDYTGKVVAGLSVSFPVFRLEKSEIENIAKKIVKTTSDISEILGYLP